MLRVDIRDLQRGPVKTVGTLGPEDPVFQGLGLALDGPVEVNGQLQATGAGEYLWRGRIHGTLRGECRRCLTDVRHPVDVQVDAAMFTDLAGFTSIAEKKSAPETVAMLNDYFSQATRHVFEFQGTLVKYIGDAVFAIWGAPLPRADHATLACRAALALARSEATRGDGLRTRIGVHTGTMVVGNLGSAQRFDYTAIGDAVNLASRIEGLNKAFGTTVLASADTLTHTDGAFVTRSLGRVRVVGRTEPVHLHELLGRTDEAPSVHPSVACLQHFARGLEHFAAGRFGEAAGAFHEALGSADGKDGPSEAFWRFAEGYALVPPEGEWDGTLVFESK